MEKTNFETLMEYWKDKGYSIDVITSETFNELADLEVESQITKRRDIKELNGHLENETPYHLRSDLYYTLATHHQDLGEMNQALEHYVNAFLEGKKEGCPSSEMNHITDRIYNLADLAERKNQPEAAKLIRKICHNYKEFFIN